MLSLATDESKALAYYFLMQDIATNTVLIEKDNCLVDPDVHVAGHVVMLSLLKGLGL